MAILPRFYVYILARPDGRPFYVGKGSGSRVFDHDSEARSGHQCHKCNIIRKIWRDGGDVQRYTVFTTDDESEAYGYEQELIDFIGRKNLANATDGGIGGRGRVASQAERETHRKLAKERYSDPAWRERRSAERRASWADPEYRALQVSRARERWADPEYRAQMIAKMQSAIEQPDVQARKLEGLRAHKRTPEAREQNSVRWKATWSDPEYRARRTFERACAQCGTMFSAITVTAKFCAERCKHRYYREHKP